VAKKSRYSSYILRLIIAVAVCAIVWLALRESAEEKQPFSEETLAVAALRALFEVQRQYKMEHGTYATLNALGQTGAIDEALAAASSLDTARYGYYYRLKSGSGGWTCVAMPVRAGLAGTRSYYIDQTGIVRYEPCETDTDSLAGPESPQLEE
jgi:hypothetical protein